MTISLYISENQYFIGIFRINGLEMLISLIYKSLTKMHAVFRAFRAIYNFVLHILNFLVDTSEIISILTIFPKQMMHKQKELVKAY